MCICYSSIWCPCLTLSARKTLWLPSHLPFESHEEHLLCSTLTRNVCEGDSGRCSTSLARLVNYNPPEQTVRNGWVEVFKSSEISQLCVSSLLWLFFFLKNLFAYFTFINPVEIELLLLNSSMKPWSLSATPYLWFSQKNIGLSLSSAGFPPEVRVWGQAHSNYSTGNVWGMGLVLKKQTKPQNKSLLLQIETQGKTLP